MMRKVFLFAQDFSAVAYRKNQRIVIARYTLDVGSFLPINNLKVFP